MLDGFAEAHGGGAAPQRVLRAGHRVPWRYWQPSWAAGEATELTPVQSVKELEALPLDEPLITEPPSRPTVPEVPAVDAALAAEVLSGEALCEMPPDTLPPKGEALVCASIGVAERSNAMPAEAILIECIGTSSVGQAKARAGRWFHRSPLQTCAIRPISRADPSRAANQGGIATEFPR